MFVDRTGAKKLQFGSRTMESERVQNIPPHAAGRLSASVSSGSSEPPLGSSPSSSASVLHPSNPEPIRTTSAFRRQEPEPASAPASSLPSIRFWGSPARAGGTDRARTSPDAQNQQTEKNSAGGSVLLASAAEPAPVSHHLSVSIKL